MSFLSVLEKYQTFSLNNYLENIENSDIEKSLNKPHLTEYDLLNLLSEKALPYLEIMAGKAHQLTIQNFGKTIQLYIPLYISNYCTNCCQYCGFNQQNKIKRHKLSYAEIEANAQAIAKTGMQHILFLTGEDQKENPLEYLLETARILKKYFCSVAIEIYSLQIEDYHKLKDAGVDGLTIYQEVYDNQIYKKVHTVGKKRDYNFRINAPERGAQAGFRAVNIGTLFGLGNPIEEAFFAGLHANYLQNKYLDTEISISLPRLNEAEGNFKSQYSVPDQKLVQFILAYRLFLPRLGITISTRENENFRDNLMPLGVTRMSAGSITTVGGYDSPADETPQFEIADKRSVAKIATAIKNHGYQAVYKDWDLI